jgi:PiT family inorganic phosphate transporter
VSLQLLPPRPAVMLSASLNLVGAFLSTAVAARIAKDLVDPHLVTPELVFAGLVGGIIWNLLTWLLGIPCSSSHALIGGIVGAMIAAAGGHGVIWSGMVSKVIIPAVAAVLLAILVGAVGTWLVYRATRGVPEQRTDKRFHRGQIGSAALVSLAHGTTDAQKTMGLIFMGLISYGAVSKTAALPPLWIIVCCAVAMGAGTYVGATVNRFPASIVARLHAGYPEGMPPTGYFPLPALLSRRLTAQLDIGVLITRITYELPSPQDVQRVRQRLAVKGRPLDGARDAEDAT